MLIENISLHNKINVFSTRRQAGELLASYAKDDTIDLLLAIPNGGVPVAISLLQNLAIPEFNLLLIRKIQVPWSTEAGFGALTPDGQVFLNNELISHFQLNQPSINHQIESAKSVIKKRKELYNLQSFDVDGKVVLVTDDGIASGFSMMAGCTWLKQEKAKTVIIAVPTAPMSSIKRIKSLNAVDKIICLNIRELYPFAVADAYQDWYDVPEAEVISLIAEIKTILQK
ncbi:MAG: phosphoribosyltransferase [Candidatus Hodarchaeales archaeon]|jgi:predicted phosphoribosyltransferase